MTRYCQCDQPWRPDFRHLSSRPCYLIEDEQPEEAYVRKMTDNPGLDEATAERECWYGSWRGTQVAVLTIRIPGRPDTKRCVEAPYPTGSMGEFEMLQHTPERCQAAREDGRG